MKKFFPTKQKLDLPPMMIIHGKKTFDKQTTANSFCMFFTTIGSQLQDQVISLQSRMWKSEKLYEKPYEGKFNVYFPANQPIIGREIAQVSKNIKSSRS